MPQLEYKCSSCNHVDRVMVKPKEVKSQLPDSVCSSCGSPSKRQLSAPGSSSKVILDNGTMPKAIEAYSNAIDLFQKRSDNGEDRGPL